MKARAALVALVACGPAAGPAHVDVAAPLPPVSVSEAPAAARAPLFPEDPSLDAAAVKGALFTQETWTGAGESQQHCREWGIDPARDGEVRDTINALLAPRGVHLPEKGRAKNIVVALGAYASGVVDRGPRDKLVVCTEGVASLAAHRDFTARLMASPRAPHGADYEALGEPDVAWRRVHATAEVEVGFRWPNADATVAARVIATLATKHDTRFKAHLRGSDLWWTGLEKP
ncbi:MAG TPA: hypothetical protein VGH28_07330 [Polyangiaceae bacterium]|jgi:hypothetical protein